MSRESQSRYCEVHGRRYVGVCPRCRDEAPAPQPVLEHVRRAVDLANTAPRVARVANNVANRDASVTDVANAAPRDLANTYRYRDPEKRRAYMRKFMAARRAARAKPTEPEIADA